MGFRAAWCCAVVLAGCGDNQEVPLLESAHIRLFADPDFFPCDRSLGDMLAHLDAEAVGAADFLHIPITRPIDYHLIARDVFPEGSPCPSGAAACSGSNIVWAPSDIPHELVHALAYERFEADHVSFFEEGLAEAVGGSLTDLPIVTDFDLDALLGASRLPGDAYHFAGDLVSYLLVAYGPDTFLDFFGQVPHGASIATIREAFLQVYGETLEEMLAERSASGWRIGNGTLGYATCAALQPLPWEGTHVAHDAALGCDQPPFRSAVDIPADGDYRVEWSTSSGTSADLRYCPHGFGATEPLDAWADGNYLAPRATSLVHLRRGRYALAAFQNEGETASVEVVREAASCDAPVHLSAEHDGMVIMPAPGSPRRVTLIADAPFVADLGFHDWVGDTGVASCDSCTGACSPLLDGMYVLLPAGQPMVLEVSASAWEGGVTLRLEALTAGPRGSTSSSGSARPDLRESGLRAAPRP